MMGAVNLIGYIVSTYVNVTMNAPEQLMDSNKNVFKKREDIDIN
jgi:hypothetical protein